MKIIIPATLEKLSERLPEPLYAVGGYVRNYLIGGITSEDLDLSAPLSAERVITAAEDCGLKVVSEYKRTGTVVLFDGERKYEYTQFRTDEYAAGGTHKPIATKFTNDITLDALRRDFTCNAVYYDIKNKTIVDPLGGVYDIENKTISTVKEPEKVFCSDGLRLMRLSRFAGELGFTPTAAVTEKARLYAENIKDIAPERIYDELKKILLSDEKYPFSDKNGHYNGIKIMEETGVLDMLFPELAAGRGMRQRTDFHNYDVLEHSLKTLLYTVEKTFAARLAALLHDVGKPYCKTNFGTFNGHAEKGAEIAAGILKRLKADKRTEKTVVFLIKHHMFDLNNNEKESAIRLFIAENTEYFNSLITLKQADYSACKDNLSVCPTVKKWIGVYRKMIESGTPFSLKDLKISAAELKEIGFSGRKVGEELKRLFSFAVENPNFNCAEKLTEKARADFKRLCGDKKDCISGLDKPL